MRVLLVPSIFCMDNSMRLLIIFIISLWVPTFIYAKNGEERYFCASEKIARFHSIDGSSQSFAFGPFKFEGENLKITEVSVSNNWILELNEQYQFIVKQFGDISDGSQYVCTKRNDHVLDCNFVDHYFHVYLTDLRYVRIEFNYVPGPSAYPSIEIGNCKKF